MKAETIIIAALVATSLLTVVEAGQGTKRKAAVKQHRATQHKENVAQRKTQKSENREFHKGLKDMEKSERTGAILEQRETQHTENQDHRATQHDENMAFLEKRLSNSKHMTDAQKSDLIDFVESQYGESVDFRDEQYAEVVATIEKLGNTSDLTHAERRAAMQAFIAEQQAENKDYRQSSSEARKAYRQKLKESIRDNKGNGK
jgi:hypothetical protein